MTNYVELSDRDLECLMASVIYAAGLLRPTGDGPNPVEAVQEARRIREAVAFDSPAVPPKPGERP